MNQYDRQFSTASKELTGNVLSKVGGKDFLVTSLKVILDEMEFRMRWVSRLFFLVGKMFRHGGR